MNPWITAWPLIDVVDAQSQASDSIKVSISQTKNTLDCNYTSPIFLLNLVQPEIALFRPPITKTLEHARSGSDVIGPLLRYANSHLKFYK